MTLDERPARPQSAAVLRQSAQAPCWIEEADSGNNEDGRVLHSCDTIRSRGLLRFLPSPEGTPSMSISGFWAVRPARLRAEQESG